MIGKMVRVTDRTETVRACWEGPLLEISEYEVVLGVKPATWTLERGPDMVIEVIQ